MSGKMMVFGAGAAIGYILGSRAGRERYDEIAGRAKRIWESDTLQDAAGVMEQEAGELYNRGKRLVADQAHRMNQKTAEKRPSDPMATDAPMAATMPRSSGTPR
jgi:hypothetical protein